jgi:hypothetical protein
MLKTDHQAAREIFRQLRAEDDTTHSYISFIHRNLPKEEENQYMAEEWKKLAQHLGLDIKKKNKAEIIELIRTQRPEYRELLRNIAAL